MKKLFNHKKGYQVNDIAPIAIALGLAIVVTVIIAKVVSDVEADQTAGSYGENISLNGLAGLDELGSWFDTIGLVVAAAVIIGILVYAFSFRR